MKTERLLKIFEQNGIEIIFAPLKYGSGGLLEHNGKWYCLISSDDPPVRQRWTMAHELGHFFLHASLGFSPVTIIPKWEREANQFAADLLMPAKWVIVCWKSLDILNTEIKIRYLANQFQVSTQAMEIRLKELGVIEDGRHNDMDFSLRPSLCFSGASNRQE